MRQFTSKCCMVFLLAGCTIHQASAHETTPRHHHVNASSSLALSHHRTISHEYVTSYHTSPEHYSNIRQVSPSLVRAALLKEYSIWAGTRYRYGGTTRRGIDCSALMQHIFRTSFDYDLPRTTLGQVLEGKRVQKSNLRPGDLVFFRPHRGDRHVGVNIGDGYFMHASTSQGVKLSKLSNPYWTRHFWTARRTMDNSELAARLSPSRVSDST